MKITFLHPTVNLSGGIRVVATHAQALAARGHEVRHFSVAPRRPSAVLQLKSLLHGRGLIPWSGDRPPSHLDGTGVAHTMLAGPTITADQLPDADVVVATWWETAEWAAALPASKGAKAYLMQDYEMFDHLPRDRVAATFHAPLHRIAVSDYIRRMLRDHHGVEGIDLVPNAVDLDHFTAPARTRTDGLTVGVVYTERPRKNLGLAIAALSEARARLPHLQAVAFGVLAPVAGLALPPWVRYHRAPAERDIPGIYASADVWLFTSDSEGFGLPLLEAMACRTPVIATAAGAAPELINGRNGVLVPSDATAFADAMQRFEAMTQEEWAGFSQAAYDTVHNYTWEDAADLFEAALHRAMTQAPSQPLTAGPVA